MNCESFAEFYPPGVDPCETGNQAHNRILEDFVQPVLGIEPTPQNGVQTLAAGWPERTARSWPATRSTAD